MKKIPGRPTTRKGEPCPDTSPHPRTTSEGPGDVLYAVGTVILCAPAANHVLRRRSDGRVRPVILAAGGVATSAAGFLLLRAYRHRRPPHGTSPTDFLPPRCEPEPAARNLRSRREDRPLTASP